MSRLTPAEHTAYRDRIAAAKTFSATMAVIKEAAVAARRPAAASPVSVRKPVIAGPITGTAPASTVPTSAPSVGTAAQDGSDIVALARSAGLVGVSPQPASEKPFRQSNDAGDIVALVRAAGLAGFKRHDEEPSK